MQSRAFTSVSFCVLLPVCLRNSKETWSLFATSNLNFSVPYTHTHQLIKLGCIFFIMIQQFKCERNMTTTMTAVTATTGLINPNSKAKHNLLTPFWRRHTYTTFSIVGLFICNVLRTAHPSPNACGAAQMKNTDFQYENILLHIPYTAITNYTMRLHFIQKKREKKEGTNILLVFMLFC